MTCHQCIIYVPHTVLDTVSHNLLLHNLLQTQVVSQEQKCSLHGIVRD